MKYLILPVFAIALLTSCGGSSSSSSSSPSSDSEDQEMSEYDKALAEIRAEEAQKEAKAKALAITVPVINSQFAGIIAGKLENIEKNIELVPQKTGTVNWDGETLYAITASQAIRVLEASNLSSLYAIYLDLLDENGVTIGSIKSGYDDNENLETALNDGSVGKAFKVSFKSEDGMTLDEAAEILKSVKSVATGTSSGDDKAKGGSAGGSFKIENTNFSGTFADNIKLVEVGDFEITSLALMIDDEDAAVVKLDAKVEVLKQSSKLMEDCYLELLDADNNVIGKLNLELAFELKDALKNGDVGSTFNVEFIDRVKESEAQKMKKAVAVKAGNTTAY